MGFVSMGCFDYYYLMSISISMELSFVGSMVVGCCFVKMGFDWICFGSMGCFGQQVRFIFSWMAIVLKPRSL